MVILKTRCEIIWFCATLRCWRARSAARISVLVQKQKKDLLSFCQGC